MMWGAVSHSWFKPSLRQELLRAVGVQPLLSDLFGFELMAMFNVLSCQPHTLCNLLPCQHLSLCLTLDALQRWDSLLKPSLRLDRRWEGEGFCPSYEKTDGICTCLNSCPPAGHCHPAHADMPEQVNYSFPSPLRLPLCEDVVQSALLLHVFFSSGL